MPAPRLLGFAALLLLGGGAPARGQDVLQQQRRILREVSRDSGYAGFLTALGTLGGDGELTGGMLTIEDSPSTDLISNTVLLPFEFDLQEDLPFKLKLEAVVGYVTAENKLDFGQPGSPTFTHVKSLSQAFALDLGLGPSFKLPYGFTVDTLLHGSTSYLTNHASRRGPGSFVNKLLTEGIIFDLDTIYGGFGGSMALRYEVDLGFLKLKPSLRYDLRRTFVVDTDDDADDSPFTSHWFTAHLDLEGPIHEFETWTLGWLASVGYRLFANDLRRILGFGDYYVFTGGLYFRIPADTPVLTEFFNVVRVTGSWFIGEDIRGWTVGAMVDF